MKKNWYPKLTIGLIGTSMILAPVRSALACTRMLWNDSKLAVVGSDGPRLWGTLPSSSNADGALL